MPRIVRDADVSWEGNLARGEGAITAASSGAFTALPYSLPTRIAAPEGKTSPEELLASAHGGCFTMSLAGELTAAGTPPGRLDVRARVDGLDSDSFAKAVEAAHAGCSFSSLLRAAGVGIDIDTTLAGGD